MENPKWLDNSIQFPRLLSEIHAEIVFTEAQRLALCETMDLNWEDIEELFSRADCEFEGIKYSPKGLLRDTQACAHEAGASYIDVCRKCGKEFI